MYEYKVEVLKVREAEETMNRLAESGWRVIEVSPNQAMGYGVVVTFEREKKQWRTNIWQELKGIVDLIFMKSIMVV